MITLPISELRRYVPKNGSDTRVLVPTKYKPGVYIWDGNNWLLKRYWSVADVCNWIDVRPAVLEQFLMKYRKHLTYIRGPKFDYANLLKIRYLLILWMHGKLEAYLETDEINSLYDKPSKLHVLPD